MWTCSRNGADGTVFSVVGIAPYFQNVKTTTGECYAWLLDKIKAEIKKTTAFEPEKSTFYTDLLTFLLSPLLKYTNWTLNWMDMHIQQVVSATNCYSHKSQRSRLFWKDIIPLVYYWKQLSKVQELHWILKHNLHKA